jgi:arabinogalactan oligomer/maltooligosaccharide transport system permease protein
MTDESNRPARPPSHRRRALVGLTLASALAVALLYSIHGAVRSANQGAGVERVAVVHARALAELIERIGDQGDSVRAVVRRWAEEHPGIRAIRVVRIAGIRLEASTAPDDHGERAPPRRLDREEKDYYDQAQRLRAAAETNRREGVSRKEEIEVRAGPEGFTVAVPLAEEGAVTGMVALDIAPEPSRGAGAPLAPILAFLLPIALFLVLSPVVGNRRIPAFAVAALLLLGAIGVYGVASVRDILRTRRAAAAEAGAAVSRDSALAASLAGFAGAPGATPLHPDTWDVDAFRHSRGEVTAAGAVSPAGLAPGLERLTRETRRGLIAVALVALALLAFFALGWAARLGAVISGNRQAYAYTLPAMLGMIVLVFFPFFYGIALSFTDSTIYNTDKSIPQIWIGLQNYIDILGDFSVMKHTAGGWVFNYLNFYWTLFFTVVWTVTNVAIGVTSGLILALILNTRGLKLRPVYRVLLILPWATPNYITALIWKGMFHQQFGVINQAIQMFGGRPVSWFDTPFTSYLTALTTNAWLSFPFMMVVSLGALQSISAELYEAARIDGASRWQMFHSITLPSLRPALIPAIILSVIWTFNMFNIIYLVTQGEPGGSTEILITQSYKFAFEKYRYGYAAAYSTVIFVILLAYGIIQNRATRATEAIST